MPVRLVTTPVALVHGAAQVNVKVAVPVSGNCVDVATWSGTYASGPQAITGDQSNLTVPTHGTTVGAPGCYSWAETLSGGTFPGTTVLAAGAPAV